MAFPVLTFGSLEYNGTDGLYSNENNINGFIRLNGTGSGTNVTGLASVAGFFDINYVRPGMVIASSIGNTTVASVDVGNNSLTTADTVSGQGLLRIRPQKGLYFFESASFSKVGTGEPTDLRDITGSSDSEYDSNDKKWGVVASLASTGSVTTTIAGEYGQYQLTEIVNRISTSEMNCFVSSSNNLGANFTEASGSQISAGSSFLLISEISDSNGLMTLAGANDLSGGGQGLGLAAYNTSVASIIAQLSSGSGGFPHTGSAQITGSLGVTGSIDNLLASTENFLIKNASAPTQSLFKIDNEGVAVFRAREGGDGIPSAIVGGLYFNTSSAFIGVD